uniref:Retrotransposon gag domain-containing protein n=1 Tax=Tanacetum cinerariifolium TaxID=118510 RepID=A0A699I1K0_TANCI|nr:hypothetical protein [Tanacetum cinerariifolium]
MLGTGLSNGRPNGDEGGCASVNSSLKSIMWWILISWNSFKEAIMLRFGSAYDDPMGDIKNLRHTGTIEEYQNAFDRLLSRIDFPEDQQVSCYIDGLHSEVELVVRMFRPKTLGQVFDLELVADPFDTCYENSEIPLEEAEIQEEAIEEVIEYSPQISLHALNGVES